MSAARQQHTSIHVRYDRGAGWSSHRLPSGSGGALPLLSPAWFDDGPRTVIIAYKRRAFALAWGGRNAALSIVAAV